MITASECDSYILNMLQKVPTKEKRLLKFKGLLNIVFSYAMDPERKYIDTMEDLRAIIDGDSAENAVNQAIEEVSTPQYPTVLKFSKRKESRKPASL